MSEMCEIINTAQFRFPAGSPRPSWADIANFIKQLEIDVKSMEAVYKTAHDRSIYIKFACFEAMTQSLQKNTEPKQFQYANGTSVQVQMCIAGTRYVRVFDLPPELPDELLSSALSQFGNVERIVREKFPTDLGLGNLHNGVRGVYIDIKNKIPPAVHLGKWKARMFYDGLADTCFHCQAEGHRKDSCPKRQMRNNQKKTQQGGTGNSSYASVVSGAANDPREQEAPETLENDVIEVLEDEYEQLETLEEEQAQAVHCKTTEAVDKERRRKEGLEALEEVARAIKDAMAIPDASQRRAQFAASGSSSGSGSRPKKKCTRRQFY